MSASRPAGLLLGVAADAVFGDPPRAHPVAAFGTVASQAERLLYRDQRAVGAAYVGVLVGGATGAGVLMQRMCRQRTIEIAATAVTTWAVLGATSLADESLAMARALEASEIRAARDRLGHLCGRAADQLDAPGLARATVESVAENTSDAIVAPLFWGAVAGIPGLVAYRAVNTLDAMVGRRSRRYRRFGWAAARLDDVANFVPARACAALTVLCAPLVGGSSRRAWRTWREDASAHPSPNAGQVEAAFAGALRIRLGGRTVYHHTSEERPVMGRGRSADTRDVARSVALSRMLVVLSGFAAAGVALLVGRRR